MYRNKRTEEMGDSSILIHGAHTDLWHQNELALYNPNYSWKF